MKQHFESKPRLTKNDAKEEAAELAVSAVHSRYFKHSAYTELIILQASEPSLGIRVFMSQESSGEFVAMVTVDVPSTRTASFTDSAASEVESTHSDDVADLFAGLSFRGDFSKLGRMQSVFAKILPDEDVPTSINQIKNRFKSVWVNINDYHYACATGKSVSVFPNRKAFLQDLGKSKKRKYSKDVAKEEGLNFLLKVL